MPEDFKFDVDAWLKQSADKAAQVRATDEGIQLAGYPLIEWSRIRDTGGALDWLYHLMQKEWFTKDHAELFVLHCMERFGVRMGSY